MGDRAATFNAEGKPGPNGTIYINTPIRQFLGGKAWPKGSEGFVVEDIDATLVEPVILRQYGPGKGGATGRILLTEWKHRENGPASLGNAQTATFGLLHDICKRARTSAYAGFVVITHSTADPNDPACRFWIQRVDESPQVATGPLDRDGLVKALAVKSWRLWAPWAKRTAA